MTSEELSTFMRAAGFVPLVKYERVHPSFDRAKTWGHRAVNCYFEVVPYETYVYIDRIFTPKRFRWMGFATRALTMLCEQADKDRVTLKLLAISWIGRNVFDYVAWYKRFGFVSSRNVHAMERKPQ